MLLTEFISKLSKDPVLRRKARSKRMDEEKYRILAEKHADFLCEKVFKPAFVMGFIHGAKHALEEKKKENDNE